MILSPATAARPRQEYCKGTVVIAPLFSWLAYQPLGIYALYCRRKRGVSARCRLRSRPHISVHVRESHLEQRSVALGPRRGHGRPRHARPQLPASLERRTESGAPGNPPQSPDRPSLARPFAVGLIPYWCGDPKGGRKPINAKCETASTLPTFRDAYRRRRCIVPVDGFFEWKAIKGQKANRLGAWGS